MIDYPHAELTRVPADLSKFWVVTIISNQMRFKRRYELYWRFKEMCRDAGVKLITVEQAFGNRQFMVTKPDDPFAVQTRSEEELWFKENLINLGVQRACSIDPANVREIAWVDADCRPTSTPRHWFEETWHQLQHFEFVQMWEWLIDLDISHNPIGAPQPSFMANYVKYGSPDPTLFRKLDSDKHLNYPSKIFGRPGLAWAANVNAFNRVGGLIDFAILGAGDWYMAHALVGSLKAAEWGMKDGAYFQKLLDWQTLAQRWIKRDVGYVPLTVVHDFHGRKALRQYGTRGKILFENKFNPDTDLKRDSFGQLQLETWDDRQIRLRDQIRAYFRARNEDSIDL